MVVSVVDGRGYLYWSLLVVLVLDPHLFCKQFSSFTLSAYLVVSAVL